jgi:hypothetical protein
VGWWQLVDVRLTNAVLFNQAGEVIIPSDYLRKNAVLVQRGNFRPPTVLNNDLIEGAAAKMFCGNNTVDEDGCVLLQVRAPAPLCDAGRDAHTH